MLALPIPNKVQ